MMYRDLMFPNYYANIRIHLCIDHYLLRTYLQKVELQYLFSFLMGKSQKNQQNGDKRTLWESKKKVMIT